MKIEALYKFLPQVIGSLFLVGAYFQDNPYGYYQILRIAIFGIALYLFFGERIARLGWLKVCLAVTALVYNPFLPISLNREIWEYINASTIILLILSVVTPLFKISGADDAVPIVAGQAAPNLSMSTANVTPTEDPTDSIESVDDYKAAIEGYISWAGFFEKLLILREVDYVLKRTEKLAIDSLFSSGTHYKVAGALIIDALRRYESNKEMGLEYLMALIDPNESEEDHNNVDDDSYHENLDEEVAIVKEQLETKGIFVPLRGNGMSLEVQAELLVYIACYIAMLESGRNIAAMSWNSFKRSVEIRILSFDGASEPQHDYFETGDTKRFVHYASEYWSAMSHMEDVVLKSKTAPNQFNADNLLRNISASLGGGDSSSVGNLRTLFNAVKRRASVGIVPKVVRAFG